MVGDRLQTWLGRRFPPPMPEQFYAVFIHLQHMHMFLGLPDVIALVIWALKVLARRLTVGWDGPKSFILLLQGRPTGQPT